MPVTEVTYCVLPVQYAVSACATPVAINSSNIKVFIMSNPPELPALISKFDQVLEQIMLLIRDVEKHRWDAGVTVLVNNGNVDVRGLGSTDTPVEAVAILFMALKSLPSATQADILATLKRVLERSEAVAAEASLWRPT